MDKTVIKLVTDYDEKHFIQTFLIDTKKKR